MVVKMDIAKTLLFAVLLLLFGKKVRDKVPFLTKYCIPAPVVGGLIFAFVNFGLNSSGMLRFEFDKIMGSFFMNVFFTASGFSASIAVLKAGGKKVVIFLGLAALLAACQNFVAVGLSGVVGVTPLLALMTGSIPLTGGHGNAAAFAPIAEGFGATGAVTVAVAAATFGLVSGCIIGGPLARNLITKYDLFKKDDKIELEDNLNEPLAEKRKLDEKRFCTAFFMILGGLGIGAYLADFSKIILPNVVLPIHVMGMLGGAIVTNVLPIISKDKLEVIPLPEIDIIGDFSLSLFVSISIMSMKLWELTSLAGPLLILLLAQLVLIIIFVKLVTFRVMGKDYDSAVISAGHVGFGLGAVPVSMANMKTVCAEYRHSKVAFFIVPVIGGLFSNFTNSGIITAFINFFK